MRCEEVEELAAAYALQALPGESQADVQHHLSTCARHPAVAGLRSIATSLALTAPEMEPPPALKARLMEAVRNEAAAGDGQAERASSIWVGRLFRGRAAPYALAGALAVAVAALLAWNITLQASDDRTLVRSVSEGDVSGRIVYIPEEGLAVMTVGGLERLPAEKTYQVWLITGGAPAPIGFLDVSEAGEAFLLMRVRLSKGQLVAVTIEPAGGSPRPTTTPIVQAEI